GAIFGRPGWRCERKRQYPRNAARCQPTTVSGFTITNTLVSTRNGEAQPQEAIPKDQSGSGILALENADLLSQGDELQSQLVSRAEEGTEPRERIQKKPDHGPSLHDSVDRSRVPASC